MEDDTIYSKISDPESGKAGDELCQWLYESYQTGDAELQAVVIRHIPLLCGVYFSRVCSDNYEPLAGFEAVLLALYTEESKARGGRPLLIHLPSLSQPSLYHTPRPSASGTRPHQYAEQLSAPLEPQTAVKSTKRAAIVGLALELFWRKISIMPPKAKLEFCEQARRWTLMGCSWASQVDKLANLALEPYQSVAPPTDGEMEPEVGMSMGTSQAVIEQPSHQQTEGSTKSISVERNSLDGGFSVTGSGSFDSASSSDEQDDKVGKLGVKLPLSLELLRPIFKVLGHCLMATTSTPEVQEAAAAAARALYVRASQDLVPEAILAARSLVRLDAAARAEARGAAVTSSITSAPLPTPILTQP